MKGASLAKNEIWLYLSKTDIETERRQCEDEGREIASLKEEFERVLALDLEDLSNQPAAEALLDRTIRLPLVAKYAFDEPSDLEGIRALRPEPVALPAMKLSPEELADRIHGAWTGRCVGCLLGKPVEGWKRAKMLNYLNETGRFPLADFFTYDNVSPEMRKKLDLSEEWGRIADHSGSMPEDDDTNYTTTGLAIFEQYGGAFTSEDVGKFWLESIPLLKTCTAERVTHKNLSFGVAPPASATLRNPYREWIGAQIRADFWGYVAPGNPELAAEYAFRDASISHVKNGVYGAMWVAAMVSASFATDDIPTIIRAGLAQIPQTSRLADIIESMLEWHELEIDYGTVVYRIHEIWHEDIAHHWCHTISNAAIVATGLLWGEGDFAKTICSAVVACFDTDCNGATTGSILGAIHGYEALPSHWKNRIDDTLITGVEGFETVQLKEMAKRTLGLIGR